MPAEEPTPVPRVYLDVCAIQRPLDDRRQARVDAEAEAVVVITKLAEQRLISLVGSSVHEMEAGRASDQRCRTQTLDYLALARIHVEMRADVARIARPLLERGIKPMDALHLASAIFGRADYLCTCDDSFLRRCRALGDANIRVARPVELLMEVLR